MAEPPGGPDKSQETGGAGAFKGKNVKGQAENEAEDGGEELRTGQSAPIARSVDAGANRNEGGAKNHGPEDRQPPKWPWTWTADSVQAACAVFLVGITGFYTWYAKGQTEAIRGQLGEMRAESTASASQFKTQLERLNTSITVEATSAAATQKLANAAATEASQAGVAAAAAKRNADASINNANAAINLANTSRRALQVAATAAAATQRLADATSKSVKLAAKALETSKSNFALDERPWVWTRPREDVYKPGSGELKMFIDIGNSGKSPAVRSDAQVSSWYSPPGSLRNIDEMFRSSLKFPIQKIGIVPPGSSEKAWWNREAPIQFSPSQMDTLVKTDGVFWILGRIRYYDRSGHYYYTDFCYYRLTNAGYAPCESHNDWY